MKMLDKRKDDLATINTDVVSFQVSPQHPHFSSSPTLTSGHARQESTLPEDTEYDFILEFLSGLKPFAIKLQETIMPNPEIHPPPPPPPVTQSETLILDTTARNRVPSFAARRAACTHLTMERLYGDFPCNVCSRSSVFGWVYCCTQDDAPESLVEPKHITEVSNSSHQHANGIGEETDSVDGLSMLPPAVDEDPGLGREDAPLPTTQLSPWIEKAIKDGHYTSEQVAKLRAQKQQVVDTARAAINHFEQSQINRTNYPPQTSTTLQSVDANPHLPFPIINEVQEPWAAGLPKAKVAPAQQSKTRMFPFCKFCACQLCRPTHRDRAWQRFDDIFRNDPEIPFIHYEDDNRPLASASVMSRIGMRPPQLPKRPLLRSIDSKAIYTRNEDGRVVSKNDTGSRPDSADRPTPSTDIADIKVEAESKGFRESMKRAFKSMLMARRPSSARAVPKRRAREGTDTTDEDAVEFDMGLWKELNDELLREASGIPLPEKDSVEGLSRRAAELDVGGLAVTEEAADLGTADVIMMA